MKKFFGVILIFICFVFVFALTSCNVDVTPFAALKFEPQTPREFDIYVCGAVEKEGFVHIFEGTDYQSLIFSAGPITQTVMPDMPYSVVNGNIGTVILRYYDGTKACDCINVNGATVTDRMSVENVSAEVINKLADYIAAHGKISDKSLLKGILGSDYADNFYKFFVSRADYEKID